MTRRSYRRVLVSALSALLIIVLATEGTLAAVTWTAPVASGPGYGYNFGMGLARTGSYAWNARTVIRSGPSGVPSGLP